MAVENSGAASSSAFAVSARDADGSRGRDEWLFRLAVEDVSGGSRTGAGMTLVRAWLEAGSGSAGNTREVKMILAGEGTPEDVQRPKRVLQGSIVGVKGPVWEVVIEGEKWGVGVEWKVLG